MCLLAKMQDWLPELPLDTSVCLSGIACYVPRESQEADRYLCRSPNPNGTDWGHPRV